MKKGHFNLKCPFFVCIGNGAYLEPVLREFVILLDLPARARCAAELAVKEFVFFVVFGLFSRFDAGFATGLLVSLLSTTELTPFRRRRAY